MGEKFKKEEGMNYSPWGIDGLQEDIKSQNKAQMDAFKEECLLYATVFNSDAGQKILKKLERVLEFPTWEPGKPEAYGYWREGNNHIVRYIRNRVNKAKEF
jgi:hypothetical protein